MLGSVRTDEQAAGNLVDAACAKMGNQRTKIDLHSFDAFHAQPEPDGPSHLGRLAGYPALGIHEGKGRFRPCSRCGPRRCGQCRRQGLPTARTGTTRRSKLPAQAGQQRQARPTWLTGARVPHPPSVDDRSRPVASLSTIDAPFFGRHCAFIVGKKPIWAIPQGWFAHPARKTDKRQAANSTKARRGRCERQDDRLMGRLPVCVNVIFPSCRLDHRGHGPNSWRQAGRIKIRNANCGKSPAATGGWKGG